MFGSNAGLETCDLADLEVCGTTLTYAIVFGARSFILQTA